MQDLIQNNKNKKTLAAWLQGGRFPHAILIDGRQGSGKRSFAKIIAQSLLCSGENPPCGECNNCIKMKKEVHPDFLVYQGEGGARSFHVDTVRELREQAYISANEADAKVFLLVNVEEMSVQAQNALLKIIEEPPAGVYFILTCENRNQMLATIRSRVAGLTMEIPDINEAIDALAMRVPDKTSEDYKSAAMQAGGNIGLALEFLESDENGKAYDKAVEIWESLKGGNELKAASILSQYHRDKSGFIEILKLIRGLVVEEILMDSTKDDKKSAQMLQLYQIVDIIDEIQISANSNVNMLLLTSILPFKVKKAITVR